MKWFCLRVLCFMGLSVLACQGMAGPLVLDAGFQPHEITRHEYLVDAEHLLTTEAAKTSSGWQESQGEILNFGLSDAVVWVRFQVENTLDHEDNLLLEFAHPLLDQIDVTVDFAGGPSQQWVVGDAVPGSGRILQHGHFLVPLVIPAGETATVMARVYSKTTLQIPMRLWRYPAFIEANFIELTLYGMFFGLLLGVAIYHLLIFAAVKESSFLYYALTNLCLLGVFLSLRGLPAVFLWSGNLQINDLFLGYSMAGAMIFPCLFTREVLIVPQTRPFLAKMLNAVAWSAFVLALIVPLVDYQMLVVPLIGLAVASLLANGVSHVIRFRDGYLPARYVLLAGIFTICGLVVAVLEKTGLIPSNKFTIGASYIGVSIMTMLYSFALAYRMNMDRDLRLSAQQQTFRAQKALLESQRKLNEELDQRVHERTAELQKLNQRLKELSTTDALTKLRNRHFFDEAFNKEFSRGYREQSPIAVLLIDMDHFKRLNDTYGHQFGDACLQQAGERLRAIVKRPCDVAARYGGEEFIVLLSNTGMDGARSVAEHIHQAFAKAPVVLGDQSANVTVSIGVVSVIPDDTHSYETIIKAADDLLYQAKANGRNQVLCQPLGR